MEFNWIEFDQRPQRKSPGYHITLNSNAEFLMNRRLFEDLDRPEAVTLYFDPDNDLIGMRKADLGLPNAFGVTERGKCGGRMVRATLFVRKWDIRLTGTYCFPDTRIQDGMLIVPLKTRLNVSRKRRR